MQRLTSELKRKSEESDDGKEVKSTIAGLAVDGCGDAQTSQKRRNAKPASVSPPKRPTRSYVVLCCFCFERLWKSSIAASLQVQHGFLGGAGISFPLRISVLHARAHGEVTCLRAGAAFAGTRCTSKRRGQPVSWFLRPRS